MAVDKLIVDDSLAMRRVVRPAIVDSAFAVDIRFARQICGHMGLLHRTDTARARAITNRLSARRSQCLS